MQGRGGLRCVVYTRESEQYYCSTNTIVLQTVGDRAACPSTLVSRVRMALMLWLKTTVFCHRCPELERFNVSSRRKALCV